MTASDRPSVGSHVRKYLSRLGIAVGGLAVVGACLVARSWKGAEEAQAQAPSTAAAAPPVASNDTTKLQVVAVVNGQNISRNELAKECLARNGADVLESMVNKQLIAAHCQKHGIVITQQEVEAEIDRMAERFGQSTDAWLTLLEEERGVTPTQYARDIIWPSVALRKLAESQITPTEQEIREAYETQFGPSVQARLIACDTRERALQVQAAARRNPEDFSNLAKQYSDDVNSASAGGLIQPIRRHMGDDKIESVAFAMQPGEISDLIAVGHQYVLLKCEAHLAGRPVPLEQVRRLLEDAIRDKKLRLVADDIFQQLQTNANVINVFNDEQKRAQYPGVAAVANGRKITMLELAEECIERHGAEVLEGMIGHRILEQECERQNVTVTQADVDEEIAHAAEAMGMLRPDHTPDVEAWLKDVEEEQGMPVDVYVRDIVWPSAALKKLVNGQVQVMYEDLKKGYEANYGPRVRCRAIVLSNQRRAQEVWQKARDNPTADFFGELAEQFSDDAATRSLGGQIPPIQRHGGEPLLEKEAFSLQPGELSSIVQVGENFVILFCEGHTTPTAVDFDEVRDLIEQDIHEKKLRLAMAQQYGQLEKAAQIDDYLSGKVQPGSRATVETAGRAPSSAGSPAPRLR